MKFNLLSAIQRRFSSICLLHSPARLKLKKKNFKPSIGLLYEAAFCSGTEKRNILFLDLSFVIKSGRTICGNNLAARFDI